MKLLSSVQQKEQIESKTKQQQVGVTAEEAIQCITLVHFSEQKYVWAAEVARVGVWMVEGEEVRRVAVIVIGDGDGKGGEERERCVIQYMTQIGSEVCVVVYYVLMLCCCLLVVVSCMLMLC